MRRFSIFVEELDRVYETRGQMQDRWDERKTDTGRASMEKQFSTFETNIGCFLCNRRGWVSCH